MKEIECRQKRNRNVSRSDARDVSVPHASIRVLIASVKKKTVDP